MSLQEQTQPDAVGDAAATAASEAAAQEGVVDSPLVFQCKACMVIVGDSFSWVCSDEGESASVAF